MILQKNKSMFFIHHFIRTFWAVGVFRFVSNLICFFKFIFSKRIRKKFKLNFIRYNSIQTIEDLIFFMKTFYKYKKDGYKSLFDHDASLFTYLCNSFHDDCDTAGYYECKKIRKEGLNFWKIGIYSKKNIIKTWHYDCIIKLNNNKFIAINQGLIIKGNSFENVIIKLNKKWKKTFGEVKIEYWVCNPVLEKIMGLFYLLGLTNIFLYVIIKLILIL